MKELKIVSLFFLVFISQLSFGAGSPKKKIKVIAKLETQQSDENKPKEPSPISITQVPRTRLKQSTVSDKRCRPPKLNLSLLLSSKPALPITAYCSSASKNRNRKRKVSFSNSSHRRTNCYTSTVGEDGFPIFEVSVLAEDTTPTKS